MCLKEAESSYANHNPFWAAPLVLALEDRRRHSAIEWAAESVYAMVNCVEPDNSDQLQTWLEQLRLFDCCDDKGLVNDDDRIWEEGDRIWQERPDAFGKIIAHLYGACARRKIPRKYNTHLVKAMQFLGDEEHCRALAISPAFRLFTQYCSD